MHPVIYRNGLVFDGYGGPPFVADVIVENGIIVKIGRALEAETDAKEIDCHGLWVMPGLLDIHTHCDLELELAPELPEVVRHGTTTVIIGNCSIGITYGHQRSGGEDPIVDCFARVENMPKAVLSRVADTCTWTNSQDYLTHLDNLPMGPNVAPLIPHSMLRIAVMGLEGAITRPPSQQEQQHMERLLEAGMAQGYIGLSTDALPFHFLANSPNKKKKIPTQYANFRELARLTQVVRRHGRVWQATPPKDNVFSAVRSFLLTSGRLYGSPLKTTVLAALDLKTNQSAKYLCLLLSYLLNSRILNGHFNFQALSASFRIWSDGVINPIADEIPELRVLNELEVEDVRGRLQILSNPAWIKAFKKMWLTGRNKWSFPGLLQRMRLENTVLTRNLNDMIVADCPLNHWIGQSLQKPYQRLRAWQSGINFSTVHHQDEEDFFATFLNPIKDEAEFFLHILRVWDTRLRWETTIANADSTVLKNILFSKQTLPGFNDSGAHLANIGFYDGNLRFLKIAQQTSLSCVAQAVKKLTSLPAEFFNLNAGNIRVGVQADICIIDPQALQKWNPEKTYRFVYRQALDCKQVINRPENVVKLVMINGKFAWKNGQYAEDFGHHAYGRVLRTRDHPSERSFT